MTDRLYRSRDDRMLAGVAGGVAEMLDADPSIIRIVWALLIFVTGGIALLVYIVMAIVVPERPAGMPIATATALGTSAPTEPLSEGSWRAPDGSAVPMAAAAPSAPRPRGDPADRTRAGLIFGLLLILLGAFFLIRQFIPAIDVSLWWPAAAILAGVLLVVLALLPSRRSS